MIHPVIAQKSGLNRFKINWFSPIPPLPTAIADYTAQLVPALSKFVDVTVWTEQRVDESEISQWATVRSYDPTEPPWFDLHKADLNIYHIGNHPDFHSTIWQISQRCPGLVILHDVKLQHLFMGLFRHRLQDEATYERLMAYYYGAAGAALTESLVKGQIDLESIVDLCPLTELAIVGAIGVIVHQPAVAQRLSTQTSIPIHYLPLSHTVAPLPSPIPSRSWQPPYRLITFGHLGTNRRLKQVLSALQILPQQQDFRWDIYGAIPDSSDLQRQIRQLGLEKNVYLHGFVSEDTLHEALSQAHLAINLRYPSMGEASASQLWIWAYALPSFVTDTEWYSSLPPDTVSFVPPGAEVNTLQTRLQEFHANPEPFMQMGLRGRALLEAEHLPDGYAAKLFDLISHLMAQPYRVFSNHPTRQYFAARVEQEFPEISKHLWLDPAFAGIANAIRFITSESNI